MSHSITQSKNFNTSSIQFSDVKTNNYGGKMIYLNKDGGPLLIQTCDMFIPYGLSENEITDQKSGEVIGHKYHINLSFKGMQDGEVHSDPKVQRKREKLREFHKMMEDIDKTVIETAQKNSLSWLKMKKASVETVEALYTPIVIKSKDKETQEPDGKYPDTIKGKIPFWDGVFKTDIYDTNKELIDLKSSLVKGAEAKALLKCTGIWFAGGRFGVGWKIEQMRVKVPETLQGYSFVESDDEDEESCSLESAPKSNIIQDSDSDDEINLKTESTASNLNKGVMESESDSDED